DVCSSDLRHGSVGRAGRSDETVRDGRVRRGGRGHGRGNRCVLNGEHPGHGTPRQRPCPGHIDRRARGRPRRDRHVVACTTEEREYYTQTEAKAHGSSSNLISGCQNTTHSVASPESTRRATVDPYHSHCLTAGRPCLPGRAPPPATEEAADLPTPPAPPP